MRVLITGAEGQDGHYLSEMLTARGHDVIGGAVGQLPDNHPLRMTGDCLHLDVTDPKAVMHVVSMVDPTAIIHLAAISNVPFAEENPEATRHVNVAGVANVLDAIRAHNPNIQLLNASTVEVFSPTDGLVTEDSPLGGTSVYARTKQEALELTRSSGLCVANVLMSNHESPLRGPQFVTGKIARGVAAIARGESESLTLGNIDIQRDWSAATDIVRGMICVLDRGFVGDVILASGITRALRDVVTAAFASVGITDWKSYVSFDESLVRTEAAVRRLDVSRARNELDWSASTPLEEWIGDMVRECV